ncbi:hypothetical protein [Flavobacterium gelatinilyticum]|uniref:hypothetical protein n=1 Tax=Flavobacterium gelatinilyticum TaxID=3003260 RepID=UPI0024808AE5|nr:hypothetical protein [Flavobacterium gelatinilyticum]
MKTLYVLGACALLSMSLFSCSADELETAEQKTEIKKDETHANAPQGPGDDPITVQPPKN